MIARVEGFRSQHFGKDQHVRASWPQFYLTIVDACVMPLSDRSMSRPQNVFESHFFRHKFSTAAALRVSECNTGCGNHAINSEAKPLIATGSNNFLRTCFMQTPTNRNKIREKEPGGTTRFNRDR